MEIKPTNGGGSPVGRVAPRAEIGAPAENNVVTPMEAKTADDVSFGKLGSTLFQNGKAMSFRDAQALVGKSTAEPDSNPGFAGFNLNATMALGGPDSPCFYKGRVMTTREAQELAAQEQES